MEIQVESAYLDLKQNLHSITYTPLINPETESSLLTSTGGQFSSSKEQVSSADLVSNTLLYFQDKTLIQSDVANLCQYIRLSARNEPLPENFPLRDLVVRVNMTLYKYLEMPSLLDNLIGFIVNWVMDTVRLLLQNYLDNFTRTKQLVVPSVFMNHLLSIFYCLFKIRGEKNTKKYFGHKTSDFEPMIFFIFSTRKKEELKWESRFVLMEWFSVLLLMPFDFRRLDSELISQLEKLQGLRKEGESSDAESTQPIHFRILDFLKNNLTGHSKISFSTARCIGVLMRRPELQNRASNSALLTFIFDELNKEKAKRVSNNAYLMSLYEVIYRLIKECPKPLCIELFQEIEEFLVDDVREKGQNESYTTHERKMRAYIGLFEKVLNINQIRVRYSKKKKEIMEGIGPGMAVEMITDQNSKKMKEEREKHINQEGGEEDSSALQMEQREIEGRMQTGEYDINIRYIDQLEDFVDLMFVHLNSSSYAIRSLAGRGLALVVNKLSPEMVKDVLDALVVLVEEDEEESENLLHGVCLALGELSSVGLLLPAKLPQVIKILKKALLFENIKGNHAGGNIVRDAGCYISWAFARGFESHDLAPFVDELANELLLVALFDNQGNCRRAAAAAFQENVGRQGNFPNGIQIISEMDFFSVGLASNSFGRIAPFVASHEQYTHRFLDHLAFNRLCHISEEIRNLAANSLALIALFDPEYVVTKILPVLIKRAQSRLLPFRHGALLGIGSILVSFSGKIDSRQSSPTKSDSIFIKTLNINEQKLISNGEYMEAFMKEYSKLKTENILNKIPETEFEKILQILPVIKEKNMLRGIGGELTKIGLCFFAECLAISESPLSHEQVMEYVSFFENCVHMTIERVQQQAPESLNIFSEVYMRDPERPGLLETCRGFLSRFNKEVVLHVKVSYANALASLSREVLVLMKDALLVDLLKNCVFNRKIGNNDPEVRKASLRTIFKMVEKIGLSQMTHENFGKIFDTQALSIKDYTLDKRGDIGCIVREETMNVYLDFLNLMVKEKEEKKDDPQKIISELMDKVDLKKVISGILTQILHPNDRLRLRAGYVLQILTDQILPHFPEFDGKEVIDQLFLNKILRQKFKDFQDQFFEKYDVALLDNKKFLAYSKNTNFIYFWNIPECSYPHLSPLLRNEHFRRSILVGYLLSTCNSLEDKIIKFAMKEIDDFISEDLENPMIMAKDALKILSQNKKREKFTLTVFQVLTNIFSYHIHDFTEEIEALILRLFRAVDAETKKTSSIRKLIQAGSLLTVLLISFESLSVEFYKEKIQGMIPRFLFSEFPMVRKAFSEEFYMFLVARGDEIFDQDMVESTSQALIELDYTDLLTEEHDDFEQMWTLMNSALDQV